MLNSMTSLISSPYFYGTSIAIIASAILIKIAKICIPIIKNVGKKFYDLNFFVSVRSFFCKNCTNSHRAHENVEKQKLEFLENVTKKLG